MKFGDCDPSPHLNKALTMKNKKNIWLAGMIFFFAFAGFADAGQNKIQILNVPTLKALQDRSEKVTLVDSRSVLECLDARIPGSVCLPCDEGQDASFFASSPKESKIVFYEGSTIMDLECGTASLLISQGFTSVYVLEGGLVAWRKASLPVVSEKRITRATMPAVKPKNLSGWLKEAKNPLLIDIRSPKAYDAGHLDGAANYPLTRLHIQYAEIPLDRTLLVVDEDGGASYLAASYLARKGFMNVTRLQGGMAAGRRGTR